MDYYRLEKPCRSALLVSFMAEHRKVMSLTQEQLKNLPEYEPEEVQILDTGETVRVRKPMKLTPHPVKGDDVVMFTDETGSWMVEYGVEGGPYKRRFSI